MKYPNLVIPANYNNSGKTVISGNVDAIKEGCVKCDLSLIVGGTSHSPLMEMTRVELA